MNARQGFALGVLAMLGLAAAAALGLLANAVAGDSIGLSASQLHAGRSLAPPQARQSKSEDRGHHTDRHGGRSVGGTSSATGSPAEPGDDHGGGGEASGPSVDNSGPGSLSSGSGDVSGSSGSNSSGSTPGGSGSSGSSDSSGSSGSSGGSSGGSGSSGSSGGSDD